MTPGAVHHAPAAQPRYWGAALAARAADACARLVVRILTGRVKQGLVEGLADAGQGQGVCVRGRCAEGASVGLGALGGRRGNRSTARRSTCS